MQANKNVLPVFQDKGPAAHGVQNLLQKMQIRIVKDRMEKTMNPTEIQRGRELFKERGWGGGSHNSDWQSWLMDNFNDLLTLAENHAKDVEEAYWEGMNDADANACPTKADRLTWFTSDSKKKLDSN